MVVCSILFTVIAYTMSNHPLEDFRILTVIAIGLAMSFTSQAYGIFAGSLLELKVIVANTCSERINCTSFLVYVSAGTSFRCAVDGVSDHFCRRFGFYEGRQHKVALDV